MSLLHCTRSWQLSRVHGLPRKEQHCLNLCNGPLPGPCKCNELTKVLRRRVQEKELDLALEVAAQRQSNCDGLICAYPAIRMTYAPEISCTLLAQAE